MANVRAYLSGVKFFVLLCTYDVLHATLKAIMHRKTCLGMLQIEVALRLLSTTMARAYDSLSINFIFVVYCVRLLVGCLVALVTLVYKDTANKWWCVADTDIEGK